MNLIAQGTGGDTYRLQEIANSTEGSGVIEFELDTELNIPGPNIKYGWLIRRGIPALELALKAIPGVHLPKGITFVQGKGRGTLRIPVKNNPVPLVLGPVVAKVLPWLVAIVGGIIGWKLFQGSVGDDLTDIVFIVAIVAGIALLVYLLATGRLRMGAA